MATQRAESCCDSFVAQPTVAAPKIVSYALKRRLRLTTRLAARFFRVLQSINPVKALPDASDPSDELVHYTMQILKNGDRMAIPTRDTSLSGVRSNFAPMDCWMSRCLREGYFSETLPELDAEAFSLIRWMGSLREHDGLSGESLSEVVERRVLHRRRLP